MAQIAIIPVHLYVDQKMIDQLTRTAVKSVRSLGFGAKPIGNAVDIRMKAHNEQLTVLASKECGGESGCWG